jgi:hypothetical protein
VEVAGELHAAILGQRLGHERRPDRLLAAQPEPAENAQDRELVHVANQSAHQREDRVGDNRQRQRAHAADTVADHPPEHRQAPPAEEHRKEDAAPDADVHLRRLNAGRRQQLAQRRNEHEAVDKCVHAVERPPRVGGDEPFLLSARQRRLRAHRLRVRRGCCHRHGCRSPRKKMVSRA